MIISNNWYQSFVVLKIKFNSLSKDQRTMEIFRVDKAIENEKLDLEMTIVQLKEAKVHLSQSLKRRKEFTNQMNDLKYVEEKIEDIFP